jgi:hypothetical protein
MMEAVPPAPFEVPKPDFLLELQIVPLDTPAQLGEVDEFAEADIELRCKCTQSSRLESSPSRDS